MATSEESASEILEAANKIFFDQIKSADQKAAYVLTVALALTVTSEVARKAFQISQYAKKTHFEYAISASHVISIILTLIFALIVIFPRFRRGGSALYWGAWPEAGERLQRELSSGSYSEVREYIDSNRALARICKSKFRSLRYSFALLIFSCLTHAILLSFG